MITFDPDSLRGRVVELEQELGEPGFWDDGPFFQRLAAALRDVSAMLDRRVVVHRTTLAETDVAGLAAALRNPPHPRAGFVIAAPDQPVIRAAARRMAAIATFVMPPHHHRHHRRRCAH